MSSKTEQLRCQIVSGRTDVLKKYRATLLILLSIAVLLIFIQEVEAEGTPSQVIVFTDKTVYKDFYMQQGRGSGNVPAYVALETDDLVIYSYAIVLDDDGNIMKGLTGINGTLDDTKRLDHYHKNDSTYHHNTTLNPHFYDNISVIYNDTGTSGDGIAGDGIYTAFVNITDADTAQANDILDDHLVFNISARFGSLSSYTEVLYSGMACHSGQTESHSTHTTSDISPTSSGPSPCTICHRGMEHFFETKSTDQNGDPTFPYSELDVHVQKIQPNYTVRGGNQALTVIWNLSKTGGTTWGGRGAQWETNMPGSSYCYVCHYSTAGGSLLDYGSGGRTNLSDRPSCSVAGKSLNAVTEAIACHSATKIEGESTLNWMDPAAAAGNGTSLNDTWKAKSHNQTTPPNKANVSCALCHGKIHQFKLPNSSVTGEDYLDIDNQCILCHNISGGLNITANGGTNTNHTNPNCKACHLNNNLKLDAHSMPASKYPNANCTQCHDLGGRALLHIDLDIFNNSDYVHNMYNESKGQRPLNFNSSTGSAIRASENKICWGCHGDDPNNDGKADFSEQPVNGHPNRYNNARRCEECHQNGSSPWGAPQNVAHSYNTAEVRTPGAPNCYDCHGQPIMFNNSHKDTDVNESNEKGIKASFANHYGTGFPELAKSRGANGYCIDFCHQNTSSPFLLEFSNKDNMQRPNHSAMTSRPLNQSCRAKECHAADAIHDEKMRKPTLAGGTFGNANCTASGCHSPSDSGGMNYSYHNNVVNCTSCHMDNIGSNIHPIKYLQNDGNDFAQVNVTAASCKLCHKNSMGDAVMNRWGVTPRKVGSQHHSADPENGSKWNKSIDPYWDYEPGVVTFANGWLQNSPRGFITDFDAVRDTNYSAARISENTTQDSFVGNYPSNNEFNVASQAGGWYSNGTATTRAWSNLPADGNPAGGIIVGSTTRSQIVDANWTAAFIYNKTGKVADARIKLDSKLVKGKSLDTTRLKAINITINDKFGNVTEIFNRSLPDVPEVDWSIDERLIPNPDSVFWKNGTLDHTYNITIRTRWTNIYGQRSPDIKVAYDNIFVNVSEVDYKKYNFTFYINETPPGDRYNLIIGYQTHVEPARLYVKNSSGFNYRKDLDSGAFTKVIIPLSDEEYGNGNIALRINDSNGPGESLLDVNEIDVKPDYIDIEYMFIESYKWKNDSRVNYPCEYCHAPNKHSRNALGIPNSFMGDNYVGQDVNSSTTWCASCHYQGYSSGSKNYTDMTRTFIENSLPVPPEITGHSLYGVNKPQSPDYYEHSGLSSFDDETCWSCHKGNLDDGLTSTVFMHNVSAGKSGGSNCTACHDPGSGIDVALVNFTSVGKGMHASLNAKASSTPQNASNKPCWACHGTVNGTWANETDQPSDQHDITYKGSARKCQDCHTDNLPLFEAKSVTDHIPSGLSEDTDVNTSKYNMVYCAFCHNNSVVESFDPDGPGRNPMNASASHYGANRTADKLMAQGSNSTECIFCHRNSSNMLAWGILPGSRANINNKNTSGGGTNHNPYTASSQCSSCHGKYVVSEGFTFHNSALGKGDMGGRNCIECHNIGAGMNNVNFSAFGESVHATINSGAVSSPQNAVNKPCWGCHGTINGTYANESDQPTNVHSSSIYKNPRKCIDCHVTGSLMFTSKSVTDHILPGLSGLTDVITSSYCTNCHNNSVKNGYEPDYMGIAGVNPMNASVSHYGLKEKLIETIGNTNTSQGCIYCHYDNPAAWGNATDPRINIMRPHVETQNSQCWGCHFLGVDLPSTFHNETLFTRVSGGSPPPVPSGSSKILVATNRFVILDDWNASTAGGLAGPGFFVPTVTHTGTSGDSSFGINTKINATALFMDDRGSPISGRVITFNLYQPNGTEYVPARTNTETNAYGLANFSFDMNKRTFYGNWTVRASNGSLYDNTSFIYNWWGCGISGCRSGHPSDSFGTTGTINSPYLSGRERPSWSNHNTACTNCHQSFDGKPGGLTTGGTGHTNYASDVHWNITCDNANCHQSNTVHGTSGQGAVIGSCYNATNCHTPSNRSDISGKSTLNNSNKAIAHSEYSENNGTDFNGTFHTPDSVVPCIICHGPMHNISKPDKTQRFTRNSITESSQCTTCHLNSSHSQNNAVNCTLCHSPDAHAPEYITNLTTASVADYTQNRSSAAGCKDCHTSSGINSYFAGKGHTPKKNDSYGYNLTEHNDIVNCNTCHDRLHWIGYLNSTGLYQATGVGAITCLDCHGGTNTDVSNTNAYWGYMTPTKSMHNNSVPCESCHFESKHGIRFLQPDMASFGSKLTPVTCVNCHQQGYSGAPLIPAPLNHSTNPYSGALWNGAQTRFWDNTSQLSSCYYCHGSVLHSTSPLGETIKARGMNDLNQSLTNSYWCANCHYKNAPDYAGNQFIIQPPEVLNLNGLVPAMAHDGTSFYNHSNDLLSGYDDVKCKTCHNNDLVAGSTSLNFTHNVGIGSSGGSNCIACHDISSPGTYPKVDFAAINISVHGNLNIEASSSPENIANKPCWGCHGTNIGAFANESDQPSGAHDNTYKSNPRKCDDCHINGSLQFDAVGISEHIMPGKSPLTQIEVTGGYCPVCHNNSITTNGDSDGIGIISAMNASASHYAMDANANLMTSATHSDNCTYCHFVNNESAQWLTPIKPLTSTHSSFSNDTPPSTCWGCHMDSPGEPSTFHASGINKGTVGGPDCISCHNDPMSNGRRINFTAMNDSDYIHRDLNKNANTDGLSQENRKCWACHGNGTKPSSGHSSNYKTPYRCDGCHVPGPGQNRDFTPADTILNVTQHYWNGTSIGTSAVTSCYNCHNASEMMLGANLDPDGAGSIYGGINGGSSSTSHYGRKRADLVPMQGTNDYCTGCHNNVSTIFPFIDNSNKSIGNHSASYPATNPDCVDCHSTGRIHDLTLNKPDLSLSDSAFCDTCHGLSGSASIKNKDKHNGTVQCSQCHLNSTRNIHPVQYLMPDRTSWATSNAGALNCTDCHRSGYANAPIIPDPLKHSNNLSNGTLWNNTPYWTSGIGSCYFCHDDTKHNSTALGRISDLFTDLNNTRKGQITTTTWCADCHYSDASNINYKGDQWEPVPPQITENNTDKSYWRNHSGYLSQGYKDNICETCHGLNTSSSMDSNNYSHSLDAGTGGGPDCISCHDIGGSASKFINVTDTANSMHNNLNGALTGANKGCYACHGDGSAPPSGHPVEYKTPKKCTDCHFQGNYSAQVIQNHIPPKLANEPGRTISTNVYCADCHNNSINNFAYSVNGSVSHYGINASLLRPTVNQTALPLYGFFDITDAQDHNNECNNCHKNYPFNLTYGNATQIEFAHTSIAACDQCHLEGSASDLHNGSLFIPRNYSCLDCHTSNSSKYKASNISGTIMATYPTTSCESNGCHGQGVTNGLLDTLNKHNINRNFSGTPGNTGTVYLNGKRSITITSGTLVSIASRINDITGGNYYASRVGGAEYYLDVDPGVGKGVVLNAEDGSYDAVNGAWENVSGTIDTIDLSVGVHTIYVRGMDIGKQWSAAQNASLMVRSNLQSIPPVPDSLISTRGNFWVNHTWQAGIGNITESFNVSVNGSWTNGTNINYSNNSVGPHGWSNISVWAFNNSGNGSLSLASVSNNTQVANNNPVQAQIGTKTVAEGNLLTFAVLAIDIDLDPLENGTNATKGTFDPVTGQFNWTPGYGDQGIYSWNFNSSDDYGGTTGQAITVTVDNVPLSITTSTPVTDPTSTGSANQAFTINLNRTSNVTWYMNGSIVKINTSVISSNYANSTAGIGVYNITAIAGDGFDMATRKWNWTVTAIPTYQVNGYVFDNFGIGTGDVQVQNETHQDATSASGQYSITGLINGTYNFSFSKTGFNTGYLEVTINGTDITNANKTIFDTTPPGQVTGLLNDTPALTTINISWDSIAEANYYQVFRNTSSLGYTLDTYWNDTGLNSSTFYEYMVRANDTYDNWGQDSSILNVITATPDTAPPDSIYNLELTTGNFFINNSWANPADTDLDHIWFRYSNGTTLQNVSKPANYLNLTYSVRYTQNISAQTVDTMGNINQTQIWFNATIPNNPPVQSPIGSKTINENQVLQFTVISTDADSDTIKYGTNAMRGTFNTSTGEFSWMPVFGDAGIYIWHFNSSDSYGGIANETVTVTVNEDTMGNCLSCHNSTQNSYPAIIQQSFGKHQNVDTAEGFGILDNLDCLKCHHDITNMFQPGFTTGTRTCTDCHTQGNFSAPIIRNHRPGGANITTTAYCSNCHNNSINIFNYNSNSSVAHYSTNNSLINPTINHTIEPVFGFMIPQEASEYNRECSNCHNPSNASYGNATLITMGHTSKATCNQCHLNADANNLHNSSFIKPVTSDCKLCHTIYADIYKAPNLTNTDHGRSTYDCVINKCHVQPDYLPKGRLDPSDHNTDFTFSPGNKPTTDPVSLNGASSLTVYRGETVTISSRIKDSYYTASRVRGAEYYIDSDPGSGKGTALSAIDGYFDASNGGWEYITGSIDTLKLTAGTHTVYVRGLDIGKQWSTPVAATLIVMETGGFVNGSVMNTTGAGIPGATVMTDTGVSADTDSTGFYSLDLMIGTYNLTAIKDPEYFANISIPSVDVSALATNTRDIIMVKKPTGMINGTVKNS